MSDDDADCNYDCIVVGGGEVAAAHRVVYFETQRKKPLGAVLRRS